MLLLLTLLFEADLLLPPPLLGLPPAGTDCCDDRLPARGPRELAVRPLLGAAAELEETAPDWPPLLPLPLLAPIELSLDAPPEACEDR